MKRALWCLLAACGGSSTEPPAPDRPAPPQPGGPVTIAVTVGGEPATNVEVMFQNADSTVIAVVPTDLDGKAEGNVESGGFVTVIEPRPLAMARDRVTTYAGVEPGDALRLDLHPVTPEQGEPRTFTLTFDPDGARTSHLIRTTCGEPQGTGVNPNEFVLFGCDSADFLVISIDDFGAGFRSTFHPAEALDGTVDLTGATYADFAPAQVTYASLFERLAQVGIYRAISTPRGTVFDVTGAVFVADGLTTALGVPAAGDTLLTSSALVPTVRGCGDVESPPCPSGMTCDTEALLCGPIDIGQQLIFEWAPASEGADYTLDLAATALPAFATAPVYDVARGIASWTEDAGPTAPNFVRVNLAVFRDDAPQGRGWDWRLVAARDGTEVTFPTLPTDRDGFDFNAQDGDVVTVNGLTTAKLPAGYEDKVVRERAFADVKTQIAGERGLLITQDLFEPVF